MTFLSVAVIYVIFAPPLTSGLQNQGVKSLGTLVDNSYNRQRHVYDELRATPLESNDIKKQQQRAEKLLAKLAGTTVSQVSLIRVQSGGTGTIPPIPVTFASSANPQLSAGETNNIDLWALRVQAGDVPSKKTTPLAAVISGPRGPLGVVGLGITRPRAGTQVYPVVVFSVELNDVGPLVASVRSRILIGAAGGLLVALLTGVLVARALTRRVLRLESTAQRVAQGDFEAHFSDSSSDELGQLASALAHMQSQLEGLDEARRRFIATASHELRTPIFSLGGFLELLQDEALDEDTRQQFLTQVREQVDRLGKLAVQLLDLTRLESGSVELAPTTTDLGVLARAVGGEFAPALASHDSRLDLRIPEEPVRVVCDSERVAQLLRILIDNVLAHTPAGTDVVVTATAPQNGTGAQLSVHDSGPGIPEDAVDRIFEAFYSADGARGAGLGLAIARELAGRMGAALEIASEPGNTTFTLTLDSGEA